MFKLHWGLHLLQVAFKNKVQPQCEEIGWQLLRKELTAEGRKIVKAKRTCHAGPPGLTQELMLQVDDIFEIMASDNQAETNLFDGDAVTSLQDLWIAYLSISSPTSFGKSFSIHLKSYLQISLYIPS
jgi:hypothetical protein